MAKTGFALDGCDRSDLDGQSMSCSGPHRAFNHTFFNSGADGHAKRPDSAGSSEAASFTVSQHGKNELYSTGTTEEMEMQLISPRHNCGQVENARESAGINR